MIVFLWPYIEWGGAQMYCLGIIKEASRDWDVCVCLPKGSSLELIRLLEQQNVELRFINSRLDLRSASGIVEKFNRQARRISTEFESYRLLRSFDPGRTVLHVDFAPWQSWILFSLLSLSRYQVFMTMHNIFPKPPIWRELIFKSRLQFLSRLSRFHIFASNQDTKNKLRGMVAESFREKIPVTYTTVNSDQIAAVRSEPPDREELRMRFGIPPDSFVVLTVGQFVDRKGRWILLDTARKVRKTRPMVNFIWLAPEQPGVADKRRIEEYELGSGFKIIKSGDVGTTRNEILRFFTLADVFVLPSYVEGLPIALLEAMALGVPSVSTNVFAIPEAVKDRETGLLIEAGDSEALTLSIQSLMDDRELADRISSNGSRFVLDNFDESAASKIAIQEFSAALGYK